MKNLISFFILLCFSFNNIQAQDSMKNKPAEAFEMKQYFFVMLTKGPSRNQDSVTAAKIQEGHMANINRLGKMGKIIVAGPFGDEGNWLGIFIFDCKTEQEVKDYLKTDPAVAAGRLNYEIHPWWAAKNCVFK
jgi:uncharacterized protein